MSRLDDTKKHYYTPHKKSLKNMTLTELNDFYDDIMLNDEEFFKIKKEKERKEKLNEKYNKKFNEDVKLPASDVKYLQCYYIIRKHNLEDEIAKELLNLL